jgi:hypothetical protein
MMGKDNPMVGCAELLLDKSHQDQASITVAAALRWCVCRWKYWPHRHISMPLIPMNHNGLLQYGSLTRWTTQRSLLRFLRDMIRIQHFLLVTPKTIISSMATITRADSLSIHSADDHQSLLYPRSGRLSVTGWLQRSPSLSRT